MKMKMIGCRYIWPVEQIRQWIEVEGLKHREVGEKLEVSDKLISKICKKHQIKSQRRGPRGGAGHPDWKGGVTIDKNGYRLLYNPDHPNARHGKYVLEHRLAMEKSLGRYLTKKEVVHHKNGDKLDNRLENLELFSKNSEHLKMELAGKCPKWSPLGKLRLQQVAQKRVGIPFGSKLNDS